MSSTKKLCISGIVIAMYIVVMFFTQSFAFLQFQIRIATVIYSFSYIFPFLILPIGLANGLSNLLMGGGLGALDVIGGFFAGIIVSWLAYLVRRYRLPRILIIPIIVLGNGLIVPIWLSHLIGVPYFTLAISVAVGQIPSGVIAYILLPILDEHMKKIGGHEYEKEHQNDSERS